MRESYSKGEFSLDTIGPETAQTSAVPPMNSLADQRKTIVISLLKQMLQAPKERSNELYLNTSNLIASLLVSLIFCCFFVEK